MIKLQTTNDINELMWGFISSAALNTALERGLFWEILEKANFDQAIADIYAIPLDRCTSWLCLLTKMGLLDHKNSKYKTSAISKSVIIDKYSQETWCLLAQEAREQYPVIVDLVDHIVHPDSVWVSQDNDNPDYVAKMSQNSQRAERFTRMLYEIHSPIANQIANELDMVGVNKLMDIGGGSGVISLALLRKYPGLEATVLDIKNVCLAGKKIADELDFPSDRISYIAGNFMQDELPSGFDMIIECDVGIYNMELFTKIWYSLNSGGRFVIISNTNEQGDQLKESTKQLSLLTHIYSFLSSLGKDRHEEQSPKDLTFMLNNVGFQQVQVNQLDEGLYFIDAMKFAGMTNKNGLTEKI